MSSPPLSDLLKGELAPPPSNNTTPTLPSSKKSIVLPNQLFWKVVGQTSISAASLYKGFDIVQQYKYTLNTNTNTFEDQPLSSQRYWKPIRTENEYRKYSTGDEFIPQTLITAPSYQPSPLPKRKLSNLIFSPNTVKYWARNIYIATSRTANLFPVTRPQDAAYSALSSDALRPTSRGVIEVTRGFTSEAQYKSYADTYDFYQAKNNPYSYSDIRIWIKIEPEVLGASQLSNEDMVRPGFVPVKEYWWNPDTNQMIGIPSYKSNLFGESSVSAESGFISKIAAVYGINTDAVENNVASIPQYVEQMKRAIVAELKNNGYSESEAKARADSQFSGINKSENKKNFGSANSAKGGNQVNNGSSSYNPRRTTVVRGNFNVGGGYVSPSYEKVSLPQMVQQYKDPRTFAPKTFRHIFRLKPNQIQYSNIGSDWTEVERAGNLPLVDWRGYKLLSVSFQFLVAPDGIGSFDDRTDTKAITESIDSELTNLRRMATSPYPVVLLGFDDILTNQLRFPYENGRGVEFVITEFNISSMFRTAYGEINRAQCDITLREVPIESVTLLDFPNPSSPPPKKPKKEKDGEGGRGAAWLKTSLNVTGTIEANYITGNEEPEYQPGEPS